MFLYTFNRTKIETLVSGLKWELLRALEGSIIVILSLKFNLGFMQNY